MKYEYKRALQIHNSSENSDVNNFSTKNLWILPTQLIYYFIDSQNQEPVTS